MTLRLKSILLALPLALAGAAQASPSPSPPDLAAARAVEREAGRAVAARMLSTATAEGMMSAAKSGGFANELGDMALRNVFGEVWARPGLDPRSRSLVTLGILIALRQTDELRIHVAAAVRNGCTVAEIEEAILQSSAYAGFPAASHARRVAIEALKAEGLIK